MGWLDKTLKNIVKSPLGKAALAGAATFATKGMWGPGLTNLLAKKGIEGGGLGLLQSLWAKPLISKPATNALMSYGLAKLMRSKNPEQAALWSAATTLPFVGMSANKYAAQLAKKGLTGPGGKDVSMWDVLLNRNISSPADIITRGSYTGSTFNPSHIRSDWVDKGKYASVLDQLQAQPPSTFNRGFMSTSDPTTLFKASQRQPGLHVPFTRGAGEDFSYFMKPELTKGTAAYDLAMEKAKNTGLKGLIPDMPFNFLNVAGPLGAGFRAAMETRKQAWERIKNERIQQLAWMYGVDPSEITGEMTNPLYDVSAPDLDWKYANQGGIMDLDAGGDVSGPGTGTSDSINAKLSDGEFVMTAKAVENFGGGSRQAGARKMYSLMNQLDPQSETPQEGMA